MVLLIIEWIGRQLVADQGVGINGHAGGTAGKTLEECELWCDQTDGCNSIAWRTQGDCWLKDKCLTAAEPSNEGNTIGFMSYYKPCTVSGMIIITHAPE